MDQKTCENCKHFVQHYFKLNENYGKVHCGHCMHPRVKNRKPDEKACERYEEK